MLISHRKKFVFVHIYKTAGTSITNIFLPYARLRDRLVFDFWFSQKVISVIIRIMKWHDHGQKQFTGVHKHAPAIDILRFLGEKKYNSYFSFIFVRNPYDLMVSLYFYIIQSKVHVDHKTVSEMTFPEFAKWHISKKPRLQLDFASNPETGAIIVNHIGRFETMNSDIEFVSSKLQLRKNRSLEHKNPSINRKSKDYRDYYDENTKKLIFSYFRKDIEGLGYHFDGSYSNHIPALENNYSIQ